MGIVANAIRAAERAPLPDRVTLAGIDWLVARSRRRLALLPEAEEDRFVRDMRAFPIAVHADKANEQHYELPPDFFGLMLGKQRKYSCCLYPDAHASLDDAETFALAETVSHADLRDGHRILELGCGWGSLSLYMAARYPGARILAVSNSQAQRHFIENEAAARGLSNLSVLTCDMNAFRTASRFDRIVSVEMFEHMSNWPALFSRASEWLADDGRMFLHVFTHRARSYRFDHSDPADWIAQHFFTGGVMPAHDLPHRASPLFQVEEEWRWSGEHYRRTAMDWLNNFDAHIDAIDVILRDVYGADAPLWRRRWRLFFLATAGLFGHAGGAEWGVGHYRLKPARS
ncbi:MAG: class I SAM-dependent methyltransferase [Hyphomicrobiales bacterium]|nr:class I SAM-dependent methyltransferase [Hyphomicrobiales bacterium]